MWTVNTQPRNVCIYLATDLFDLVLTTELEAIAQSSLKYPIQQLLDTISSCPSATPPNIALTTPTGISTPMK